MANTKLHKVHLCCYFSQYSNGLHVNNTVTLQFTISVIKAKTNTHNRSAIREHTDAYYRGPPTFTKEQDQPN